MAIKNQSKTISRVIKELIDQKSSKDNAPFTASQLADAIDVHRSVITKLIQQESKNRVTNPRIETLIKIVQFFRNDGLEISLDDLVGL